MSLDMFRIYIDVAPGKRVQGVTGDEEAFVNLMYLIIEAYEESQKTDKLLVEVLEEKYYKEEEE